MPRKSNVIIDTSNAVVFQIIVIVVYLLTAVFCVSTSEHRAWSVSGLNLLRYSWQTCLFLATYRHRD